ncbi:MAG TPA: thioredoxin family protein [Campylobacterales bacterium]|nr:thioredoxin family protein [Campylobacterales bacterium]
MKIKRISFMKKILLFIMIVSLSLFASEEIHNFKYESDFNKAVLKAKSEKKLVVVMMSLSTCPVCDYMKDIVFEREQVLSYLNENYVMVIYDIDWGEFPERFETKHAPTFYFIDPLTKKEIYDKKTGGAQPEKFIQDLTDVKVFHEQKLTALAQ